MRRYDAIKDLRRRRQRAGVSQRELAARTGIAQPNICAYESGRLTPNAATLARIEAATRVRPSEPVATMRSEIAAAAFRHKASDVRVLAPLRPGRSDTGA